MITIFFTDTQLRLGISNYLTETTCPVEILYLDFLLNIGLCLPVQFVFIIHESRRAFHRGFCYTRHNMVQL